MNYEKISPKKKTDSGGHKTYAHSVPQIFGLGNFYSNHLYIYGDQRCPRLF